MKKYLILVLLVAGCSLFNFSNAQCVKPTPLSDEQVKVVVGTWAGTYDYNGEIRELKIDVSVLGKNEVYCKISNPPIKGKETECEAFFCGGGEFHMRKYIGDVSYVFQGVPENGEIRGLVSMYTGATDRKMIGHFKIEKTPARSVAVQ